MATFEGQLVGANLRFVAVVSRFNAFITEKLLAGALDTWRRHGVEATAIDVAWVPGTFEMPVVARRLAGSGQYHGVCCLGAVIRGGTPHFEYVASQVARGVADAAASSGVPVSFGVLTTDTVDQAIERAGTKAGNKGAEAALATLETANLLQHLPG